eukprot:CAMPEP_0206632224 /NCGR_PEP_ID=MMETSP0325_2-20121206/68765_2 /ASSEMBLY_ACC=CAM_ASM_000347 /TAXON_ID=2866 /ORGANISM="Crypthecodinium cohnii, Strain Seligo" /LENGTH=108 /DNA_ID=CAMNT_0054157681 /DNA_START=827 /DNA_END=1153 /DNA_ORIENTATION=-
MLAAGTSSAYREVALGMVHLELDLEQGDDGKFLADQLPHEVPDSLLARRFCTSVMRFHLRHVKAVVFTFSKSQLYCTDAQEAPTREGDFGHLLTMEKAISQAAKLQKV